MNIMSSPSLFQMVLGNLKLNFLGNGTGITFFGIWFQMTARKFKRLWLVNKEGKVFWQSNALVNKK